MSIKPIKITVLTAGIMNLSFAFTPLDPVRIIEKKKNSSIASVKKDATEFVDFSGTWKGTCTFENYETEEVVHIQNNDKYINFGTKQFLIGNSMYSESNSTPNVIYFDHKKVEWSDDGKSLNMQGTKVVGVNFDIPLTTYLFTDTMSLVNDQILISIKVKGFQNMTVITEERGDCVLSRV